MPTTWQHEFFSGIPLDFWRAIIPALPTREEADFLAGVFGQGKHLLDLACGNGRHAAELASRGFQVTGVDLSEEFIREANSRKQGNLQFVRADMLSIPPGIAPPAGFDGAYCFGNSIGYFDREDLRVFLAGAAGLLKTGAAFVADTGMAAESILASLPRGRWFRFGDQFMLSEHRYDALAGRLDIDYTFIRDAAPVTYKTASFVFTLSELSHLLGEAGFDVEGAFSSHSREPFTVGSPRLLLVGRRR